MSSEGSTQLLYKIIIFFPKEHWSVRSVSEYLKDQSIQAELRSGFSHIVAICNYFDPESVKYLTDNPFMVFRYDYEKKLVCKGVVCIDKKKSTMENVDELLNKPNNIQFDLENFGFVPIGSSDIVKIYEDLRAIKLSPEIDLFKTIDCGVVVKNGLIHESVRRNALEIFALNAAIMQAMLAFHEKYNLLGQYTSVLTLSFLVRAKIEKLMLLFSKVDSMLDHKALLNSKKVRSTFLKQAKKSGLVLTQKFAYFLQNVDILDEQFRNPEAHKSGRLLNLVHNGKYPTLINELLSFHNESNGYYRDLLDIIIRDL